MNTAAEEISDLSSVSSLKVMVSAECRKLYFNLPVNNSMLCRLPKLPLNHQKTYEIEVAGLAIVYITH